jgi:transglutaminase-like putative cysteine protease
MESPEQSRGFSVRPTQDQLTRGECRQLGVESSIVVAFGLLLIEIAVLVLTAQAWLFAGVLCVLAFGALAARRAGRFLPVNSRWFLTLAALCELKLVFAPHEIPAEMQFIRSQFAHEFARFLICAQLLLLCDREFLPRRRSLFAQLGWVALIFGCDVRIPDHRAGLVQAFLAAAMVLQGLYGMSIRRSVAGGRGPGWVRFSVITLTLIVGVVAGTQLANGVERNLEAWISSYLFPADDRFSSSGFSGRGTLEAITMWRQSQSHEVVLQAICDESPGYVAGRVFDTFQLRGRSSEWSTSEPGREITRYNRTPEGIETQESSAPYFGSPTSTASQWRELEFWSKSRNRLFVPQGAEILAVHAGRITYSGGTYSAMDRVETGDLHYRAYVPVPSPRVALDESDRACYVQSHVELDPQAALLAERIFAGCTTTSEKCRAVEKFLRTEFRYSLEVVRPRGDQISDFLLHNREGHCEYFATAAALLLRLGGVPTRYVTGYILTEQNPVDGSWLARNSHAHAWAIAYDERLQSWQVVEATPSAGVPQASSPMWWEARTLAWNLNWRRWLARAREVGFTTMIAAFVREHWLIPLAAAILAVGLSARLRRWNLPARKRSAAHSPPPAGLMRVLKGIDRKARRLGMTRAAGETLQVFAGRVQGQGHPALANAYREYARFRYSRSPAGPDLAGLRMRVRRLLAT